MTNQFHRNQSTIINGEDDALNRYLKSRDEPEQETRPCRNCGKEIDLNQWKINDGVCDQYIIKGMC